MNENNNVFSDIFLLKKNENDFFLVTKKNFSIGDWCYSEPSLNEKAIFFQIENEYQAKLNNLVKNNWKIISSTIKLDKLLILDVTNILKLIKEVETEPTFNLKDLEKAYKTGFKNGTRCGISLSEGVLEHISFNDYYKNITRFKCWEVLCFVVNKNKYFISKIIKHNEEN